MKNDLRIVITKRMLREGLLSLMEAKPVSRITVSELCRESGINRATFYNHYDTPLMLLKEIVWDYKDTFRSIYFQKKMQGYGDETALESSLFYIYSKKDELKILISDNGEFCFQSYMAELIRDILMETDSSGEKTVKDPENRYMQAIIVSYGIMGLIFTWINDQSSKTPKEIMQLIHNTFAMDIFLGT